MTARSYLDFNATAPIRPEVIRAMVEGMKQGGNASSVHTEGRSARSSVEKSRKLVANLVGCDSRAVIFTGSGTEANNQALNCTGHEQLIVSSIEHESVLKARTNVSICPVTSEGVINLEELEKILHGNKLSKIVSLMYANNETGVIQPVIDATLLAHKYGALMHCDAVQAAGKIPIDFSKLNVDFLSLSAHKIGGPQGVGALISKDHNVIKGLIRGGGQENGLRAGTENVPGIIGYGVAAEAALLQLENFNQLCLLRNELEKRLLEIGSSITFFAQNIKRLPNTSKFATPGLASEVQVMAFDLDGVSISAGSACSAGRIDTPYVLSAMGVEDDLAKCAVRVSLGWTTTQFDVDRLITSYEALYARQFDLNSLTKT